MIILEVELLIWASFFKKEHIQKESERPKESWCHSDSSERPPVDDSVKN